MVRELKGSVGEWERLIFGWACNLAQELAKTMLEDIDEELMKRRDQGLKVEGLKEHRITSVFGDFKVRRRLYRDSDGPPKADRFLLDEMMGLDKGCHTSPKVKELATFVASHFPYKRSEEILGAILPSGISHTSIHRLVAKVTNPHFEVEEKEIEEVFSGGVIVESEGRVVPCLFVEADGTGIALQREEARRAEVKVGVAYEGWERVSKDRYRVENKTVYTGIMDGDRFWEGFSVMLAKKYDLPNVGKVVVGGDGAPWVKEGAELLGGIYQLDRFHLKRAINGALSDELAAEVYQACTRGEIDKVDRLLMMEQQGLTADKAKEVAELRGYLIANSLGLRDYRLEVNGDGLRGVGAIESNVDKLVANRMKKRGMSWTIKGAQRMTRLISLREMGGLHSRITRKYKLRNGHPLEKKTGKRSSACQKDTGTWLEAALPALKGAHQDRPWAKVLRNIAYGVTHA